MAPLQKYLNWPTHYYPSREKRTWQRPALTTYLSLAGSYLVLMPNNPKGGGISRRIEGEEREKLRATLDELTLPDQMSVIIRTAGVHKSPKELQWDLDSLLTYFDALKLAATMDRAAPYLIHQESNVLIRTLRDYMREDIDEVILDDKECFDQAHAYMKQVRPGLLERVKHYDHPTPLFVLKLKLKLKAHFQERFAYLQRLYHHRPNRSLSCYRCELIRAPRGKALKKQLTQTEAAKVARQLRLRDLGGLIIVDHCMNQFKHQREVEKHVMQLLT